MDINTKNIINSAIKDFKIISKKELSRYEKGYIGKRVYRITLYDGSTRLVEQITKNGQSGDAVVIIPITKDGKFVTIIESRPNLNNGYTISFPAGMIDKDETDLQAAKRELLEETGFQAQDIEKIEEHYQDEGCSSAVIKTFLATNCKLLKPPKLDGFENIRTILLTYKDLLELLKSNKIKGANSKIALMTYELKRKRRN